MKAGYRADIDGLRAVAVLLVLFFHIDLSWVKGGFVGVDVFFTISGFLISGIVLKQARDKTFSFKEFYIRRALRLLPAYLFLLLVVGFVCWYVLAPLAFDDFVASALFSTVFASNFYFLFNHGGYFSTSVHELPLLHTWSLAVEEQFYLIMPAAILLWARVQGASARNLLLASALLFSIWVSYYFTYYNASASYFLVISRVHEFLIGSLLALLAFNYGERIAPGRVRANVIFLCSLIALFGVAFLLSSKSDFPGLVALIPCLATAGIIYAGFNPHSWSHRVLGNTPLVWIGLLSYSLYLWHWPIVSLLKYAGVSFSPSIQGLIVLLSLLSAWFSYYFVERKMRFAHFTSRTKVAAALYVLPCLLLGSASWALSNGVFQGHAADRVAQLEEEIKSRPEEGRKLCHSAHFSESAECMLGVKEGTSKAILWGDSHANHFTPFIDVLAQHKHESVRDITMGNCPPVLELYVDANQSRNACIAKNRQVFEFIHKDKPETVYLAASWFGYINAPLIEGISNHERASLLLGKLDKTVSALREEGVANIIVFDTMARAPRDLSHCYLKKVQFPEINKAKDCSFELTSEQQAASASLSDLVSTYREARFISINDIQCKEGVCQTVLDGIPLYRDANHLNRAGSRQMAHHYLQSIQPLRREGSR